LLSIGAWMNVNKGVYGNFAFAFQAFDPMFEMRSRGGTRRFIKLREFCLYRVGISGSQFTAYQAQRAISRRGTLNASGFEHDGQ